MRCVEFNRKPTNVNPYTGASFSPVLDSQEKTNESRDDSVQVKYVEERAYENAYARNQKVNPEHVVVSLTAEVTGLQVSSFNLEFKGAIPHFRLFRILIARPLQCKTKRSKVADAGIV